MSLPFSSTAKIAVIGGGIAGSVVALRLAEQGVDTTLIEQSESLVNGPPFCHLHAGGSFYRHISDQQCLELLHDSVLTLAAFPDCADHRPTVIAVPTADTGCPEELIPRLEKLRKRYAELATHEKYKVLGDAEDYFRLFDEDTVSELAKKPLPKKINALEDWLIPVAKTLDFSKVKFPLILVQEYGLNGFRFAATATMAATHLTHCHLRLNTQVIDVKKTEHANWQLKTQNKKTGAVHHEAYDYLINACGFQSGDIDDLMQINRQRMVEFKAAYLARWDEATGRWPELMFHGERGTPDGMAQLTPYADGYFQLHGMSKEITLFKDGLVKSMSGSAQPTLPAYLLDIIQRGWPRDMLNTRTERAIHHVAKFIPAFSAAKTTEKSMYGAQQIPGDDASLRAAEVSFVGDHYARAEIVKACSAVVAAERISNKLKTLGMMSHSMAEKEAPAFAFTQQFIFDDIQTLAEHLAEARAYPAALARRA